MSANKRIFSYKGMRVNTFGLPVGNATKYNYEKKNKKRVRDFYNLSFVSPFKKSSVKNLIVMFDIHENKKKERDWFRRQLVKFEYTMIQKSVWVGPSPLPKEFMNYIKKIGIGNQLKTFKLARPYGKEKNNIN